MKNSVHLTSYDQDACICNLKINYCDVNCCCDEECSAEDRLVFGYCENEFRHYDTRLCDYTKNIYVNNTPHEWQVNQNSLFCVVRSNLPPTYIIQKKNPLKTVEEANFQKSNKLSWLEHDVEEVPKFSNDFYTYGKPVWTIKMGRFDNLKIAKPFFNTRCTLQHAVEYLIDMTSTCVQTDLSEKNRQLLSGTYFEDITIIGAPQNFDLSSLNNLKNCSTKICLKMVQYECKEFFENCAYFNKSSSKFKTAFHRNISKNVYSYNNLVKNVKFVFYHNGTSGIEKVEVFLIHENISFDMSTRTAEFSQTFEVIFKWSNHSLNYSSYLSGNPGYLIGKPILIAEDIVEVLYANNTNSSSVEVHKIFRDPLDFRKDFMVLPDNDHGSCILNRNKYIAVEFGYNMYTKCKLNDSILKITNASANNLCSSLQKLIFKYWSLDMRNNSLNNKLVGQFGNSNIHHSDKWSRILFKYDLKNITNQTRGQFEFNNTILTCLNISTLLSTEIYYSRIDFKNTLNQNKILATTMQFNNFKNISFKYDTSRKYINFTLRIETRVAFFDITSEKMLKIVDPPSLDIKLPSDFFYPFVRIKNNANKDYNFKWLSILSLMLYAFSNKIFIF